MTDNMPNSMHPNALRIDDAAKLLINAGGRIISEAILREDIDGGFNELQRSAGD